MNVFFLFLLGFVGKLMTSTAVYNLQAPQLTDEIKSKELFVKNSRQDVDWTETALLKFLHPTEIKKVVENYTSYVALDLCFELIKNVIIYVARLYY